MDGNGYNTMIPGQLAEDDLLFEVFHESTKFHPSKFLADGMNVATYLRSREWTIRTIANRKRYPTQPGLKLLPHTDLNGQLGEAISGRVSSRNFARRGISFQDLSNLLFHSAGVNRQATVTRIPSLRMSLRPYPSAGGLYPLEVYAALLNVEGVQPSVVHYDPIDQRLATLRTIADPAMIEDAFWDDDGILRHVAAIIMVTATFQRSTIKYGARGYRFSLLEAGHLAQNIGLVAAGLGLGAICWGGFFDNKVDALLGVDGVDETIAHVLFVGHTENAGPT